MPYFEGPATIKHWRSAPAPVAAGTATSHANFVVFPLDADGEPFAGDIVASTMALAMSYNWTATSVSQIFSSTYRMGLYTRSGSTLNLINSASGTFGATAASTGNSGSFQGHRFITIASSQWSAQPMLSEGAVYYMALQFSSHITTTNMSWMNAVSVITAYSRTMYGAGAPNATNQPYAPMRGIMATSTAVPTTIQMSQVTATGAQGSIYPWIRIDEDPVSF